MFQGVSLRKISIILFLVLVLMAILFSMGTLLLTQQMDEINTSWLSFRAQQAEKARLETSLRATLGYGGMIHDFKNYILRKDFERLVRLQRSLGASQAIVTQYKALSSTQAEKMGLDDIQEMLNNYQKSLVLARKKITEGKTSDEIDLLIRINDKFALRGLKILRAEIAAEYPYHNDQKQKSVLATLIRTHLGYGGMIHSFKNYVLRNDKKYFDQTLVSIEKIEKTIAQYNKLNPLLGELTALEDIRSVLKKYKQNLPVVEDKIKKGQTPEQIDHFVKINDNHALRGLTALDHDIVLQIEKESGFLSDKLLKITKTERLYMIAVITLFIALATGLYWLFTEQIINPVQKISAIMSDMAEGKLDVEYAPSHDKTELGAMFKALSVFKENELERRKIEEEIRHMAMTDPLTGLANRNQLEQRYKDMAALAKRDQRILAVLLLDLDKFKPVNDDFGHAAGDAVLKKVSNSLLNEFRETDLVARLGGDEFVVILYGPESIDAVRRSAQRIINILAAPILVDGHSIDIGVSIGIALHLLYTENLDLILQYADNALYKAKEAGRNTYRVYDPEGLMDKLQPQDGRKNEEVVKKIRGGGPLLST